MINKFLEDLKIELTKLNSSDVDDTIDYFKEMIEDKRSEGFSDKEILDGLASPIEIAKTLNKDNFSNEIITIDEDDYDFRCHKDEVNKINIDSGCVNIKLIKSMDDYISIKYPKSIKFDTSHHNKKLNIESGNYFIFKNKKVDNSIEELLIYLPISYYVDIDIDNISGEIYISDMSFNELEIENVSGCVDIYNSRINNINVDTVSGDVKIGDIESDEINIDAISSNIDINDIKVNYINIETMSGDIELSIIGNKNEYNINIENDNESYQYQSKDYSKKEINLESMSGNINYEIK